MYVFINRIWHSKCVSYNAVFDCRAALPVKRLQLMYSDSTLHGQWSHCQSPRQRPTSSPGTVFPLASFANIHFYMYPDLCTTTLIRSVSIIVNKAVRCKVVTYPTRLEDMSIIMSIISDPQRYSSQENLIREIKVSEDDINNLVFIYTQQWPAYYTGLTLNTQMLCTRTLVSGDGTVSARLPTC